MTTRLLTVALVIAFAAPAMAHGGGYVVPPGGGDSGPQAAPGFGDPSAPVTRWESWWANHREDLLRIAEHVDASHAVAVTPSAGGGITKPDAARQRCARAAAVRGEIMPHLLRALRDRDFDVRASAAVALGKLGDASAADPLMVASRRDERDEVRRAALLALGLLGRRAELPFLCDVVADRDRDMDERAVAALATGLLGGDDAAAFLSFLAAREAARPEARRASDVQLLGTVYAALGVTGSADALPPLRLAADDENGAVFLRGHAVLALGRLGDRDSIDRFVALLRPATDPQLRRCAAIALGRVTQAADGAAIRALSDVAGDDRDAATRRSAIAALGRVRAPGVRSMLRARFDAGSDSDRPFVALAMALQGDATSAAAIRDALRTEHDESVRAAYCTALGLLGDHDSARALEEQVEMRATPGLFRGYAALALAVIPSPESRGTLWKRMRSEGDARVRGDYAVALGLLGDTHVKAYLLGELRDGAGNFDKCHAAASLGVLRCAGAVPDLVEILHSERADGIVRSLCAVALGQIGDPSPVPKLARLAAGGDSSLATRALAEALTIL